MDNVPWIVVIIVLVAIGLGVWVYVRRPKGPHA
jgi:hypothetical protein